MSGIGSEAAETTSPSSRAVAHSDTSFKHALKWSYVLDSGRLIVSTGVAFLLARLLGPEIFGVASIALTYVFFVEMLQRQGLGAALIQRPDLDEDHLDAAFWAILVTSCVLTALSIGLAGWWAAANDAPLLKNVVIVLSAIIPLKALVLVQESILRRQLGFRPLATRTNLAVVISGAVAVTLAALGAGVWALVTQQIVADLLILGMLWQHNSWRPRRQVRRKALLDLAGFSSLSFLATVAVFIGNRVDALLIGVFFGARAAGLYYFATRLVTMVTDLASRALQGAALPELSRYQHDLPRFSERTVQIIRTSALIALPLLALVAGASNEIVGLVGETEWGAAATVLRILAISGAARALAMFTGPMLQALGRPGFLARLSWMAAALSAAVFVAAGLWLRDASIEDQVVGLAASRAFAHVLILVVYMFTVVRVLTTKASELFLAVAPSLFSALAGFGVVLGMHYLLESAPLLVRLGAQGCVAVIVMAAMLVRFEPQAQTAYAQLRTRLNRVDPVA